MKTKTKFTVLIFFALFSFIIVISLGSVRISLAQMLRISLKNMSPGFEGLPADPFLEAIFWNLRLPRTILAFLSGAALAVSGAVMQSVLQNPLASSFTLGVSSGAAFGASIAMVLGISVLGIFTVVSFGLVFGLLTVFLAIAFVKKLDKGLSTVTIILAGTAFSLFINALQTMLMAFSRESTQRLIFWQLGSFSLKSWEHNLLLLPVVLICSFLVFCLSKEMDILSFGEEEAKSSGIDTNKIKTGAIVLSTVLTVFVVSVSGVIGFVDLFVPHISRRIFGASHRYVIPACVITGGTFMMLCDLIARTIASPTELPLGAVTSIIGAPFFLYIYFRQKKEGDYA